MSRLIFSRATPYDRTTYFCTVHAEENQAALQDQAFDAITDPMVIYCGYDIGPIREAIKGKSQVIWSMARDKSAKFGWRFDEIVFSPEQSQ